MALANPYIPDGEEELHESICLYADVIGLKDAIGEANSESKLQELFKSFCSATKHAQLHLVPDDAEGMVPGEATWAYSAFSDCFVLGFRGVQAQVGFEKVMVPLAQATLHLATQGFFLRGGLATGMLHVSRKVVFGPALIEAYKIESTVALNPRIVLSDGMKLQLKCWIDGDASCGAHGLRYEQYIWPDHEDDQQFFNYLLCTHTQKCIEWEQIDLHRQRIQEGLEKHAERPVVYRKYKWLANYHNRFCGEVRERAGFCESYLVKCSDL